MLVVYHLIGIWVEVGNSAVLRLGIGLRSVNEIIVISGLGICVMYRSGQGSGLRLLIAGIVVVAKIRVLGIIAVSLGLVIIRLVRSGLLVMGRLLRVNRVISRVVESEEVAFVSVLLDRRLLLLVWVVMGCRALIGRLVLL